MMWYAWFLFGLIVGIVIMSLVSTSAYDKGFQDCKDRIPPTDVDVDLF